MVVRWYRHYHWGTGNIVVRWYRHYHWGTGNIVVRWYRHYHGYRQCCPVVQAL